jgi:ABC-type multidrug transport system permease subunit
MVTPASPLAVVLGKILPYLVLSFAQLLFVLFLMRVVFRVPVHGSVWLLLGLSAVYLFALLSLGLLVSSRAKTQMEATQLAQMFLLPSIMLSGYIFPLSSLPGPLRALAQILPATHCIAISRGIVIRGASFRTSGSTWRRCSSSLWCWSPAAHGHSARPSPRRRGSGAEPFSRYSRRLNPCPRRGRWCLPPWADVR